VLAASLRDIQGVPHAILYRIGELAQVLAARSNPDNRLPRRLIGYWRPYSDFTISCQGESLPQAWAVPRLRYTAPTVWTRSPPPAPTLAYRVQHKDCITGLAPGCCREPV
jgi:hypothetical protein